MSCVRLAALCLVTLVATAAPAMAQTAPERDFQFEPVPEDAPAPAPAPPTTTIRDEIRRLVVDARTGEAVLRCTDAEKTAGEAGLSREVSEICARANVAHGDRLYGLKLAKEAKGHWQEALRLDPRLLDDPAFAKRMAVRGTRGKLTPLAPLPEAPAPAAQPAAPPKLKPVGPKKSGQCQQHTDCEAGMICASWRLSRELTCSKPCANTTNCPQGFTCSRSAGSVKAGYCEPATPAAPPTPAAAPSDAFILIPEFETAELPTPPSPTEPAPIRPGAPAPPAAQPEAPTAAPAPTPTPTVTQAAEPPVVAPKSAVPSGPRSGRGLGAGIGFGYDGLMALAVSWMHDEFLSVEASVGILFPTLDTRLRLYGARSALTPVFGFGMLTPFGSGTDHFDADIQGGFPELYEHGAAFHVDVGVSYAPWAHLDLYVGASFLTTLDGEDQMLFFFPHWSVQAILYL